MAIKTTTAVRFAPSSSCGNIATTNRERDIIVEPDQLFGKFEVRHGDSPLARINNILAQKVCKSHYLGFTEHPTRVYG